MSTHSIQFHDKIKRIPKYLFFELSEEFLMTRKRVRISRGKPPIGFRAIEIRLYM